MNMFSLREADAVSAILGVVSVKLSLSLAMDSVCSCAEEIYIFTSSSPLPEVLFPKTPCYLLCL